jgi:hypothetical protein
MEDNLIKYFFGCITLKNVDISIFGTLFPKKCKKITLGSKCMKTRLVKK